MKASTLKADILLLTAAVIWGTAFVAQRVGMDYVGPFTYNGIRFALGGISLLPLLFISRDEQAAGENILPAPGSGLAFFGGVLTGLALFAGASLQQVGLVYTTAGKAGFITGLYVIIVPLMGLIWRQKPSAGTWIGAVLASVGLYLLSVTQQFMIEFGDLLNLIGAFFWAGHVLIIAWLSPRIQPIRLAFWQFIVCSLLSLLAALVLEEINWSGIRGAAIPILYGGLVSVGVAYTLQVVAQRDAHPAHAAILLSMECPFAALGGWVILNEILGLRGIIGAAFMLAGMLLSQLWGLWQKDI
jgi:drug/metabolite transporter (DMT)-like permease